MDGLIIRDFRENDRAEFIAMCTKLYDSEATAYRLPPEHMTTTFTAIMTASPFLRGLMLEQGEEIVGYAQLSFTYSNEAGGEVVWLEELYVKHAYQGKRIGYAFMKWLLAEYRDKVKRYRLEVSSDNERVVKLYEQFGFTVLPYQQLVL